MAVEIKSNQITGITLVSNDSDAANKNYVDVTSGITTSTDDGNRLFAYSDGSTQSWEPIGAYQEYTSSGTYTFTIPLQVKELFIEATGAGGGGASANTDGSAFINDGILWIVRTYIGNRINTLMYGGGYYVSGGGVFTPGDNVGQIIISTDAVTWILRTSSNINGINASTYKTSADNPYVVGGYGPLEWTQRTSGTAITLFNNVQPGGVYDGTNYFIGGSSGVLITSTDSITWVLRTSGFASRGLNVISYFSGDAIPYLAGGNSGSLNVSTDGVVWQLRTSGTGVYISGFAYKSTPSVEYLVSGGSGFIATSTDTITWILRTSGRTLGGAASIYYNSQYYALISTTLITSTNGIQWSARTTPSPTTLYSVYSDGSNLIANASTGRLITSTNGVIWVLRTSGFGTTDILASSYGNNIYTIGGASGQFASSTDTITWTSRNSSFGTTQINGIIYGNNTYVMAGQTGTITTSTDAILSTYGQGAYLAISSDTITWTLRTTGSNTQNITALASNSGFYIAGNLRSITNTSNILVSTDSINWVVRTSPFSSTINSIIYDGTLNFVAVGGSPPECAISSDTIIWTLRTTTFSNSSASITASIYGNSIYLVGGTTGRVVTSTDTITWTLRTTGNANDISTLSYNSGIYLAGSVAVHTSTDAIIWTLRTTGFSNISNGTINAAIYGASGWALGGRGSTTTNARLENSPFTEGFAGSGGGGGATVSWNISEAYITGSSLTVNVGQGGSAGQAGAASTVSWTGNSGTYALTANGGSGGSNAYNPII